MRGALQEVLRSGEPVLDRELEIEGRTFLASYFPVRDGGDDFLAVGAAVVDVTERMRAEAARERLQAATASLAAAVNLGDAARATVIEAGRALSTTSATLMLIDQGSLILVEERGLPLETRAEWSAVSLSAPIPAAECVRVGHAIYVTDEADLTRRWPVLEGLRRSEGSRSFAALPLIVSGRPLGALALSFSQTLAFDVGERDLLEALATQSAIALARAQLYEREHAVAQTLQASLLPRALPDVPGLDLAARLHGGTPGLDVGGDFYDAFALAGRLGAGDRRRLRQGRGRRRADRTRPAHDARRRAGRPPAGRRAACAQSRGAGRDAAGRVPDRDLRPRRRARRRRFRPRVGLRRPPAAGPARPRRRVEAARLHGHAPGRDRRSGVTDVEAGLDPGDVLLLYTDGLTEAGAPQRTLTTADVAELLAATRARTAAETAERCLARAIETGGGELRDDVAVLVGQVV